MKISNKTIQKENQSTCNKTKLKKIERKKSSRGRKKDSKIKRKLFKNAIFFFFAGTDDAQIKTPQSVNEKFLVLSFAIN